MPARSIHLIRRPQLVRIQQQARMGGERVDLGGFGEQRRHFRARRARG